VRAQDLLRRAESDAKAGRLTEAISVYQQALRVSPRDAAAEVGLAQAYRGVHNYEEARHILERAARRHPKDARPLAVLGDLDLEMQTYDAAIRDLTAALALDPSAIDTRDRLALAYKSKGDATSALVQLAKVVTQQPGDALAHYLRAQIYSDRNEDERALGEAEKAVELQPQNPRARIVLGKVLLRAAEKASAAEAAERCTRAADVLQPAVEAQPDDSEALFLLSRACRCAGRTDQAEKALAQFERASQNDRATQENEKQAMHLVQEANNRAQANDLHGALDLLQQALGKDPQSGAAYSQLAKLYYSAGDIEKASEAIAQALARGPFQPDFLYVRGKILEKQGKPAEALAAFEQATLVNPKESDAYFEMGVIYQQLGDRAHALAAYKKAVELAPGDPDYRKALADLSGGAPSR